ncbi:hypothetical protein [Lutibacter sp.]|uniref:hypothetical protein n=1 Tax=Lutibacter sp. TaxID=1925666 RepID=UPI001A33EC0F|nr:hypothetical protein [Lutibacter sp.]MBI9040232.1 hypothetical protein [Lutibacter sp.]
MNAKNVIPPAKQRFERKFYRVCNEIEFKKDYLITFSKEPKKNDVFTRKIRIEKYLGKGYKNTKRKDFKIILRLRTDTNWERCYLWTGLLPSQNKRSFFGDIPEINFETSKYIKKHLIVIQFSDDWKTIVLDVFKGFIPKNNKETFNILQEHPFIYNNSLKYLKSA